MVFSVCNGVGYIEGCGISFWGCLDMFGWVVVLWSGKGECRVYYCMWSD